MKTIRQFALIGAAAVVALMSSCTKDKTCAKPKPRFTYDNKDLRTVIKLANPKLYSRMYEQKDLFGGTVLMVSGVNDGFGNCDDKDCLCTVIVTTTYPGAATDSLVINHQSPDLSLAFNAPGDATLILANPDAPVSVDPKTVQVTTNADGDKKVLYVPF